MRIESLKKAGHATLAGLGMVAMTAGMAWAQEAAAAGTAWESVGTPTDERTSAQLGLLRDGQLRHHFRLTADGVQWDRPGLGPVLRLGLPPGALGRLTEALPSR